MQKQPTCKCVNTISDWLSILPMIPGFCVSSPCTREKWGKGLLNPESKLLAAAGTNPTLLVLWCPAGACSIHIWARYWHFPISNQVLPRDCYIFKPLLIISSSILHCSSYFSLLDTWIACEGGFHTFNIIFPFIIILLSQFDSTGCYF